MSRARFHLALPVRDLEEAHAFYLETLGSKQGRHLSYFTPCTPSASRTAGSEPAAQR
jgi:catechol 2,3-dioxygenase-like lactoylglutathione lyase family enzyme